jgi:hypothetical protein
MASVDTKGWGMCVWPDNLVATQIEVTPSRGGSESVFDPIRAALSIVFMAVAVGSCGIVRWRPLSEPPRSGCASRDAEKARRVE